MANINITLSYTDVDGNLDAATLAAVERLINAAIAPPAPGAPLVTLSPTSLSVGAGATASCTVSVTDQSGNPLSGVTVGLSTGDATIATIEDTTGTSVPSVVTALDGTAPFLVNGVAAGNTTVIAVTSGVTATATVVVGIGTPSLTLLPTSISVATSGTTPLFVHLLDGNNNPLASQVVTLTSSLPSIATVPASVTTDSTGAAQVTVTAVAAGQTVITASVLGVSASSTATVQAAATGAQITIAYTDFATSYMSTAAANATMAFIAGKTNHKWKILNGTTPSGGYPSNVVQIPYMLVEQVKCYDAGSSILVQQSDDYNAYCTAHSLDPEDGYLHYTSGDTTMADTILSIDSTGVITLKYDTQTKASVYAVGQTVTTAGNSNALLNGTWTLISVQSPATAGGSAKIQINSTSGASGTGGTVSRTGDGTKTLANRYRTSNAPFTPFWHINPASTVRKSYELDRLSRVLASTYTGYGVFVDSMSNNIFPSGHATVEYNPANSTQWHTDMASLLTALRATMGSGPWRYQINTGAYTDSGITQLISAAGSAHMESILKDHSSGYWPGVNQSFVATQLANGSAVEILNDVSVVDSEASFGAGLYVNDPLPLVGNAPAMRYTIQSYINALMVWDGGTGGGELAINLWNDLWLIPTPDTGGIDHKWLGMLDYPFGTPTAAATSLVSGVTDPLGQSVSVHSRAYGNNLVVYRTTTTGTTVWSDTAAYTVTLPLSTGAANKWQRVKSDGTLDTAIATIDLRPMEGVMLVPAGGSVSLSPTSGSVAVAQAIAITVTVLDASGNPVPSQTVTLSSSVTADLTVPASVTTDSAGQATFNATGVAAGSSNVTATANGITSSASAITVTAASSATATDSFAADSIALANGAGVASWTNDADNTRNATQGTPANDPTFEKGIRNGLPMVFWPTVNRAVGLTYTAVNLTAWTRFYVLRHAGGSSISHHGTLYEDPGYKLQLLDATLPATLQITSHRGTTDGVWQCASIALPGTIVEITYDSSSVANVPGVKVNGTTQTVTTITAPVGTQTSSAGTAAIGNSVAGTDSAYIYIGENTVWDHVLATADEATEGQRLGTKWAIANSY